MADSRVKIDPSADTDADWLGLRGAKVLVAGAGGIGSECVAGYAAAGADVLVADRDETRLKELADVVQEAVARLGGLDVLLHCVGINDRRPVLDFTEEEWDRVLRVNLGTAFGVAQAAGRHMVAQGSGRIVMLSSVSGWLAHSKHGPYAASKGGMNQMMRVMAREWASSGVTVNAVAPGYVETNLTSAYLDKPGVRDELTS